MSEYVRERILALREQSSPQYSNIACLRTNAQKYLIHYFRKGQLTKLFFLFPVGHPCALQQACIGIHVLASPSVAWHAIRSSCVGRRQTCEIPFAKAGGGILRCLLVRVQALLKS